MSFSSCCKSKLPASLALAGILVFSQSVMAAPWATQLGQQNAALCGKGTFSFFGFAVYDAELFSDCDAQVFDDPFALRLSYQRQFSREQLIESSVQEMQRISGNTIPAGQMQQWQSQMEKAFVNVEPGDTITGVFLPGTGAAFYVNDKPRYLIDDPGFARSFFGIWLDRNTRAPGLRASLLGDTP